MLLYQEVQIYSFRASPSHITILETIPPFYNATLSDSDKSWPSKKLVYHTLEANNWPDLPTKIQFIKT